jgi:hypothetical protein
MIAVSQRALERVSECVCVCVCACVRACVRFEDVEIGIRTRQEAHVNHFNGNGNC